jgi:hypothetical protein
VRTEDLELIVERIAIENVINEDEKLMLNDCV